MGLNPVFYLTHFAQLANIISKCSVWDSACVTVLAQTYGTQIIRNGVDSETGPLDPMFLDPFSVDDGSLKFSWADTKIVGLADSIVETVQFNTQDRTFRMRSRVPSLIMLGNYTSAGSVDDVPYYGQGRIAAVHNNFVNELVMKYTIIEKEGKNYMELESYTYWFETPDSRMEFEGLNKDDAFKALRATEHSNVRFQKLWQQFGRNMFNPFNDKIFGAIQKFFRSKPVDAMLFDY